MHELSNHTEPENKRRGYGSLMATGASGVGSSVPFLLYDLILILMTLRFQRSLTGP